jgi:hypothetical protein
MTVRGTTKWRHAIIQRKVINLDHDGNRNIMCGWDTCERDGFEMHKVVTNDSAPGYPPKYMTYVFCSERHKQYWVNSIHDCNNLPAGYKSSIL